MTSVVWLALAWGGCEDRSAAETSVVSKALSAMVGKARAADDPSGLVGRVRELSDDDGLCTDGQRLNAAYVLMEGDPDDLRLAHELARAAYEGGLATAGRTAARAWDLALVEEGEPQGYGMVVAMKGSTRCIYSIGDEISDEQRAALGLDGLQGLLDAFAEGVGLETPTSLEDLEAGGHVCDLRAPESEAGEAPKEVSVAYQVGDIDRGKRVVPVGETSAIPRNAMDLTFGELYGSMPYWSGNAYTVRKGQGILRPFRRSAYGITDHVQVGSALLGWLYGFEDTAKHGANAFVELAPLAGKGGALSLELGGFLPWRSLDTPVAHGESELKGTVMASDTVAWTVGGYFGIDHYGERAKEFQLPLEYDIQAKLEADISLGRSTMVVLSFRHDIDALYRQEVFAWGAGTHVAYAKDALGFSLGLNLERPAGLAQGARAAGDAGVPSAFTSLAVIPTPQGQLWVRL